MSGLDTCRQNYSREGMEGAEKAKKSRQMGTAGQGSVPLGMGT